MANLFAAKKIRLSGRVNTYVILASIRCMQHAKICHSHGETDSKAEHLEGAGYVWGDRYLWEERIQAERKR
jgi:hypothetical protein